MADKYRLSPKAAKDYFDIYTYSAEQFGEAQAERYTNGLLDAISEIVDHNLIGRDVGHIRAGYFRYEYERHTIYYKLDSAIVTIVRILNHRQDPLRHLLNRR